MLLYNCDSVYKYIFLYKKIQVYNYMTLYSIFVDTYLRRCSIVVIAPAL